MSGGTLIKTAPDAEVGGSSLWHHSLDFDGERHTTACGRDFACQGSVVDVQMDVPDELDGGNICYECASADTPRQP